MSEKTTNMQDDEIEDFPEKRVTEVKKIQKKRLLIFLRTKNFAFLSSEQFLIK